MAAYSFQALAVRPIDVQGFQGDSSAVIAGEAYQGG